MSTSPKSNLILMADDDSDDRLLAQDAINESGLDVELKFVEDGAQLMDYLKQRNQYSQPGLAPRPGLIVLDLNMPRMDGREALNEIKTSPDLKRIPVVILTTSTSDTDVARVYDLGANSFVSKPVAFESLVGLLKHLEQYWFKVVVLPAKARAN